MSLVNGYMFIIISVLIESRERFSVVNVLFLCVKYYIPERKKSTYFFEDPSYVM